MASIQNCGDTTWLKVNSVGAALHILAAFYIVWRIQQHHTATDESNASLATKPVESEYHRVETTQTSDGRSSMFAVHMFNRGDDASSWKRVGQVLCYDVGVALYILFFAFWIGWQSYGIKEAIDDSAADECEYVHKWVVNSIVLGFVFMTMVACSFCCSMLCMSPI